jgi:hypothetical protein
MAAAVAIAPASFAAMTAVGADDDTTWSAANLNANAGLGANNNLRVSRRSRHGDESQEGKSESGNE